MPVKKINGLTILENEPLKKRTTFGVGGLARYFCVVKDIDEIKEALNFAKEKNLPIFILGGGSNVLISDEGFPGLVIHPQILGIALEKEDTDSVFLKVGAGEDWDKVVEFVVEHGWWGIENLSRIPGKAGGFVIQNSGAFGQEISQVLSQVDVLDRKILEIKVLPNADCIFGYRKSIFNTTAQGQYIVVSLVLKLSKRPSPNLNYGDVKTYFSCHNIDEPTQKQIRQAIREIRDARFPYPDKAVNGNAGSFLRGGIVSKEKLAEIEKRVKEKFGVGMAKRLEKMKDRLLVLQGYKAPTAFLLELCGLKGFQMGNAKVNEVQPALLLNATGKATAKEILALAEHVKQVVKKEFGLNLEIEPELVGFQ